MSIASLGRLTISLVGAASGLADRYPDSVAAFLGYCVGLGAVGMTLTYALCAAIALSAQIPRKGVWLRLAAPVVCYLIAQWTTDEFLGSWREMLTNVPSA